MFPEAPGPAHRPPHQRTGRARVFDILSAGRGRDRVSRGVDVAIVAAIGLTVATVLLETVDPIAARAGWLLDAVLAFAVVGLTASYGLRLWACTCEEAFADPIVGRLRYALTPLALVDALALLPFYLALLAEALTLGNAEVGGIGQLFLLLFVLKLARYSTALRTLARVLHERRGELASVLIVDVVLLLGVASAMYVVEGDVHPEAFSNLPETVYWSLITMSSVGYSDITPVTQAGRIIAGLASLLGVAMFALPAGVLGAGFTEAFQEAHEDADADDEWGLPHE